MVNDPMVNVLAIIGASYLQLPVVERAKEMGLRTICFAWPQGAVCKEVCDRFYPVSITEKEEILRICREEQITGICTIGSDVAAPTVAYVAQQMGLPGNAYDAAVRAHDKKLMQQILIDAGVDCPKTIDQLSILNSPYLQIVPLGKELSTLNFPLIVKPTDRSGSLGVQKVESEEDLQPAINLAKSLSIAGEAIVEEYIEGREISVEMISQNGVHYAQRIFAITRRALDALGLTNGASHSEYKITADGRIVVMEIAGRMGGDFIGSDLVQLSTGYDFLRGVIEVAIGQPIHVEVQQRAQSSVVFEAPENLTCSADRTGYIIYRNNEIYKQSVGRSADL